MDVAISDLCYSMVFWLWCYCYVLYWCKYIDVKMSSVIWVIDLFVQKKNLIRIYYGITRAEGGYNWTISFTLNKKKSVGTRVGI